MARPTSIRHRGAWAAVVLLVGSLLLAACSGSTGSSGSSASSGSGASGTLTIAFGNNTPFVDDFNPFSPTSNLQSQGLIYEPLWFFDMADASQSHPWLATSYAWSNGGKTLTAQLRHNVKWSDGKPFTAADVAFTFNLIKNNKSLNQNALPIAGATTKGQYTAVINFTQPSYTDINYIAGTTYIVPQHLWSSVSDPSTYQ
ncbi:MAG TPA: ABC transporter substrate-binding protein, partial [Streptosporangiaceae bacterium]|nr:ABC transporter substrate-binding protein [Streptosporangiaceae bacterium]